VKQEAYPLAVKTAEKALKLDPANTEAHHALAAAKEAGTNN
jgi:Flp pilus assembly protein TadD